MNRYVVLTCGHAFPLRPILVLFDLEQRGFRVRPYGGGLVVHPASGLTADDAAVIRRWKWELIALLEHPPQQVQ